LFLGDTKMLLLNGEAQALYVMDTVRKIGTDAAMRMFEKQSEYGLAKLCLLVRTLAKQEKTLQYSAHVLVEQLSVPCIWQV